MPIIIDEIQKVPGILDDIHWLIENKNLSFIMTGSSARKVIRGQANLLGGRAWKYRMFGLCFAEIPELNIIKAFQNGLLPRHYNSGSTKKFLNAYLTDYIAEEIQGEALVRNVSAFSKFLRALSGTHGGLTNYSSIASDCGVDSKTVKEYYQILIDTLIGFELMPYSTSKNRSTIQKSSKFYLCDVGLANHLAGRTVTELNGTAAGESFEHFIFLELLAANAYLEKEWEINFWRTKLGHEVDFVLTIPHKNGPLGIECKISTQIAKADCKGLVHFMSQNENAKAIVVCFEEFQRRITLETSAGSFQIDVIPWKIFLKLLWTHKIEEFSI